MFSLVTVFHYMLCLVAQSCLTLCDSMDCSPPGSSVHWDSPGKDNGVGCHALFQGINTGIEPRSLALQVDSFTIWATREAQDYRSGYPIPSPEDLPNPGIEPGSPVLQVDSLPTKLPGKHISIYNSLKF